MSAVSPLVTLEEIERCGAIGNLCPNCCDFDIALSGGGYSQMFGI